MNVASHWRITDGTFPKKNTMQNFWVVVKNTFAKLNYRLTEVKKKKVCDNHLQKANDI